MTEATPVPPLSKPGALPLPAFAVSAGPENASFRAVSGDLFYRDRDARLTRVFQALCQYAEQHHDARVPFTPVLRWMLTHGNAGITVELSLHHALQETVQVLEKGGYARLVRHDEGSDPEAIELHDPMESRLAEWLLEQYGAVGGQAAQAARLVKAGSFPSLSAAMARFNLPAEQAQRLFLQADEHALCEPYFAEHPGRLLSVRLHSGTAKPFELAIPPGLPFSSLLRLSLGLLKDFHDTHSRFAEEVRQRLKAVPDMNLITLEQVFQGLLGQGELVPEQKFIHWATAVRGLTEGTDFHTLAERLVNTENEGGMVDGAHYGHIAQAAELVFHALINSRELLKQRQWEQEAEAADRKLLLHHLIEGCRRQVAITEVGEASRVESVFYPVGLAELGALKDSSGQLLLKDKYSEKHLVDILRAEGGEGVPPVIRLVVEEQPVFFHRFRLMDILWAELAAETNRLSRKLSAEWAELPSSRIPEARHFEVSHAQLSPLFRELLTYTYYVLDAYPTSPELVRVLFPQGSDIAALKLSNSDLVWTPESNRGRATPQERCQQFRELFYTSSWSITRRTLVDLLGLDYDAIRSGVKALRQSRSSVPLRFDSLLDLGLYRIATMVLNSIWGFFSTLAGLFSGRAQPAAFDEEARPAVLTAEAKPRRAEPSARKAIPLAQAADRFGVPSSRAELKERIEASLAEWNQVIFDPKSMVRDWAKLRVDERDRAKKKLEGEARARMKQAQDRVDLAIERTFENLELEGLPPAKLTEVSTELAKQFRQHNLNPLVNYIRDSIVYLNTTE